MLSDGRRMCSTEFDRQTARNRIRDAARSVFAVSGRPGRRLAPPQLRLYVIWQFSPNKDQAQQFLVDYARLQ